MELVGRGGVGGGELEEPRKMMQDEETERVKGGG